MDFPPPQQTIPQAVFNMLFSIMEQLSPPILLLGTVSSPTVMLVKRACTYTYPAGIVGRV